MISKALLLKSFKLVGIALAISLPLYVVSYLALTRYDSEPRLQHRMVPTLEGLPSITAPAVRLLRFDPPGWVPRWVYDAWDPLVSLEGAWRDCEIEFVLQRG